MKQTIDDLYDMFFYNLHIMINELNFQYKWAPIFWKRYINFGEYDIQDFGRLDNKYLQEYKETQLNLAKDILDNGMYVPFYGGVLEQPINPNLFFILQGKHRLYALKRYLEEIEFFDTRFLYIIYPHDIQYFRMNCEKEKIKDDIKMYQLNNETNTVMLMPTYTITQALKTMDFLGGKIGELIYEFRKNNKFTVPDILQNKNNFNIFIQQPFTIKCKQEVQL